MNEMHIVKVLIVEIIIITLVAMAVVVITAVADEISDGAEVVSQIWTGGVR